MLSRYALKQKPADTLASLSRILCRQLHSDGRQRLSNFWTPAQVTQKNAKRLDSGHDLLVRAGYLRQAHAGIFHLLPLGLRVQDKIERLIDKHMQSIGASKVSLSSITSEEFWQRSGRLDKGRTSELFQLADRKGAKYLLSPTHEEEITAIVANAVHSYKDLPLRLYQVSRKYRDELRSRQGLMRGREFVMKDLYTFDASVEDAQQTYREVRSAYAAFMDELGLPYLTARADSGNMGGSLSHEYHLASEQGEDTIIGCNKCDHSINEELYVPQYDAAQAPLPLEINQSKDSDNSRKVVTENYVSKDRQTLCVIYYPADKGESNIYAVKAIFRNVDTTLSGGDARSEHHRASGRRTISFKDPRLFHGNYDATSTSAEAVQNAELPRNQDGNAIMLTKARRGDSCPSCSDGTLNLQQAVEIGHTFYLGQRYSTPLDANVLTEHNKKVPIEMGCHGIGVSRLIGAAASMLADKKGLNWPLAISPFEALIAPAHDLAAESVAHDIGEVYDWIACASHNPRGFDVAIDDRQRPLVWKLNDADLVGFPFIVVMGRAWRDKRMVELQCRRLGVKEEVEVGTEGGELLGRMRELSEKL